MRHNIPAASLAIFALLLGGCGGSRALDFNLADAGGAEGTVLSGGAGGGAGGESRGGSTGSGGGRVGGADGGGTGGMSGMVPKPDAGGIGGALACGPVCLIFCEFGNVKDANGCPTCKCNPAPTCKPVLCKLGCREGFKKDAMGCELCECAPATCAGELRPACDKDDRCRWLEPGCTEPKLAAAACFDKKDVDCRQDKDCSGGRQCVKRTINTCPPGAQCLTCASPATICL